MKIKIPSKNVAICAPNLDLICFFAHVPNAFAPPALLMRATIIPRITKKIKIPAFHVSAITAKNPSFIIVSNEVIGLNSPMNNAPQTIPTNNDEYTSLVTNANTIAIIGGTSATNVPKYLLSTSMCPVPPHSSHSGSLPKHSGQTTLPPLLIKLAIKITNNKAKQITIMFTSLLRERTSFPILISVPFNSPIYKPL